MQFTSAYPSTMLRCKLSRQAPRSGAAGRRAVARRAADSGSSGSGSDAQGRYIAPSENPIGWTINVSRCCQLQL